jgi:diacylglycerol kinase family enzyme
VCISAGTRNHFALDLGLDRDDPRKGLVALREGVQRHVDYATVADRRFVNNVSLGVYATIVQEDDYRDAKRGTSLAKLPELLGRQAEPFDLQLTTPEGREVDGAFLIMVSNNPYVFGPAPDVAQRRSMDSGRLGVVAVTATTGAEAARLVAGRVSAGVSGTPTSSSSTHSKCRSGPAAATRRPGWTARRWIRPPSWSSPYTTAGFACWCRRTAS